MTTEDTIKQLSDKITALEEKINRLLPGDGIGKINLPDSVKIDSSRYFASGDAAFKGDTSLTKAGNIYQAIMFTGADTSPNEGVDNSQVTVFRDEINNRSRFFGLGGKIVSGSDVNAASGSTTFTTQKTIPVATNALVGQRLIIEITGNIIDFGITANTKSTITCSTAAPTTITNGTFLIYDPVELGSEYSQWRRLFLQGGVASGIQFGGGLRNNGGNSLLYASGNGLIFRRPNGSDVTLVSV